MLENLDLLHIGLSICLGWILNDIWREVRLRIQIRKAQLK